MLAKILDRKWKSGLTLGLALGGLLALLLHLGWHTELGIQKPVRWLASCPPLSWRWVMDLAYEIRLGILVTWWGCVGAAFGWLIEGHKADRATAVLLAILVVTAHNLAYDNIGLAVERQIREFKMEVDGLF